MIRTPLLLAIVTLLGIAEGWPANAQVRGTILGPGARAYPIAVAPLKNDGSGGGEIGIRFADVVNRDLTLSGYFKVLDRAAFLEQPETSGTTAENIAFEKWSVLGALALVKGSYLMEGDSLTLEARLFDVYQRRQIAGKRYRGGPEEMRRMAHRFADEIMAQFTGTRGPFDSRLAFVSTRDGRFKELYVTSLDGEDVRQITRNRTITLSPAWAPDLSSLLFTSYKRGNPDLYMIDLLTARETLLSDRPGLNLGAKWSPDGSKIAVTLEDNGNADIVLLDGSGKLLRRLTDNWSIDVSPSWSPDGRQLAFCSNRSGSPQIYVMSADGGEQHRVSFSGSYNTSPAWSPTGDKIAYVSRMDGGFNLFVLDVRSGTAHQLTQAAGNNEDPTWGPDGRYIVFSSTRRGRKKLYLTDSTGASQVQLTQGGGDDSSPAWSRWLD
jgi:TolB protein